jgi:hypothetical protein
MLTQLKYYISLILCMTLFGIAGRAQTTLAVWSFTDGVDYTVDASPAPIGSPTMIMGGTATPMFYTGSPVSAAYSACQYPTNNTSYFELTINTSGYSSITVDFNEKTSSSGVGGDWDVTANDGSGYGAILSNSALPTTSWYANGTVNLGASFNNNASIKVRWTSNNIGAGSIRLDDVVIKGTVSGPAMVLASANPAVAAGNVIAGSAKNIIYDFNCTVSNGPMTLNTAVFTSAGTYVAADVTKFQLWSNTSNTIAGAFQVSSDITTTLGTGTHTFSAINTALPNGTTFFFVTTDIAAGAIGCHTINASAITTANLTFASGTQSGAAFVGSSQTVPGSAPTTQSTAITFPATLGTSTQVSWTSGNGTGRIVVASLSPIVATPTNGTIYTANATFGSGTALAAGVFVVYDGAGNTVTVTGEAAGTKYYYEVFDYNCGNKYNSSTATGNPANCTTLNVIAPAGCTAGGVGANEYITGVVLPGDAGVNINNTGTGHSTYTDYATGGTVFSANLTVGNTYTITVQNTSGFNYVDDYADVWIDWNNDGVFSGAGEQIKYTNPYCASGTGPAPGTGAPFTIPFTVPAGATKGNVRMRIAMTDKHDNINGACGSPIYYQISSVGCDFNAGISASYGEVEDYALHIVAACPLPITPAAITGTAGVCQASAPSGIAYSVAAVANATSYSWSYSGTGLTITAGATTNSITASFSGAATSGNLTVFGIDACGNGPTSPAFAVTVSAPPTASNAGPNQYLCANPATMAANAPGVGTGAWSVVNGTGTITTVASAASTITAIPAASFVTLRWTTTNGACKSFSDCVVHLQ